MIGIKVIIKVLIKQGIYAITLLAVVLGVTFGIASVSGTNPVVDVQAAESQQRVGQVHQQQLAVKDVFADKHPPKTSFIVASVSETVTVSVIVLDNLSLSIVDGQPKYATNWSYGATLHKDVDQAKVVYYTVTANY